jgi:hypothetical protein
MASSSSVKREVAALEKLITELESDRSLEEPSRLSGRIDALDRLDAHLSWNQSSVQASGLTEKGLLERAERIFAKLESLNQELYLNIRRDIQAGAGQNGLLQWCLQSNGVPQDPSAGQNYDYLDELISGVLQLEDPSAKVSPVADEMVLYQPTPARHIFDLIHGCELIERDVFVDLGSGLGHVSLVVSICTQARCVGIEIEAAYVRCSSECARTLNLSKVTFLQGDARDADLSMGTVFYLYTPFVGSMLKRMLDLLRQETLKREIRVCAFGPCTSVICEEPWLKLVGPLAPDRIAVFHSCHER